jgi:hypothetical protein
MFFKIRTNEMTENQTALPALTIFLMSLVWVPAMTMALLLLFNLSEIWIPAIVVASIAQFGILWWIFSGMQRQLRKRSILILLIILSLSSLASVFFYDTATDGRWYHADAILGLLHGINPINSQIPAIIPVYANHYPKASWYFAAFVIHCFHLYQLGKIYNFLLIFACGLYAYDFFRRYGIRAMYAVLLAGATALNPVAASQMLTYYVDGALGSLLTLLILAIVNLIFKPGRYDWWVAIFAMSLACSMKFTGLVYVCVAIALLLAARLIVERRAGLLKLVRILGRDLAHCSFALLLGVAVLGYNPYVTNLLEGHHLMYPVLGHERVDFISITTPPSLLNHGYNSVEKLLISFFAPTQTFTGLHAGVKIPFTVSTQELISLCAPDTRIAGWGVLFSGVVLGSLFLFAFTKCKRKDAPFYFVLLLAIATSIVNPEMWWARYAPQIELLPVFILAAIVHSGAKKQQAVAIVLCVFMLINCALSGAGAVTASYIKSQKLNNLFAVLANQHGAGEYWAYRIPGSYVHYEQFSGANGIVICGQIDAKKSIKSNTGFPMTINQRGQAEVTLIKGECALPPPY